MNPFKNRASEQMGMDYLLEYAWLVDISPEEYAKREQELLERGKIVLQTEADRAAIAAGTWVRASGDVLCDCGEPLRMHPCLHHYAILRKLCNGQLVKL